MLNQIGFRTAAFGGHNFDAGLDLRSHPDMEVYRATALVRGDGSEQGAPATVGALLAPDDPNVVGFIREFLAEVEFKVGHNLIVIADDFHASIFCDVENNLVSLLNRD